MLTFEVLSYYLLGAIPGGSSGKALWLLLASVLVIGGLVAFFYYQEWKVSRVYKRRPPSHLPHESERKAGISLAEEQRMREKPERKI